MTCQPPRLPFSLPTLKEIAEEIDKLEQYCRETQKVANRLRALYRAALRVQTDYGIPRIYPSGRISGSQNPSGSGQQSEQRGAG